MIIVKHAVQSFLLPQLFLQGIYCTMYIPIIKSGYTQKCLNPNRKTPIWTTETEVKIVVYFFEEMAAPWDCAADELIKAGRASNIVYVLIK